MLAKIKSVSRPGPQFIYDFSNESNKLLLFDMQKQTSQVLNLAPQIHIPYHYSSTLLGSKVYFAGGDDDGYRKESFAISIKKRDIKQLSDLHVERRNHTLAAFHVSKIVYSIGGYNKAQGVLNVAEKYAVSDGQWRVIAPLKEKRQWPGLCPFNNVFLYCFAGSELGSIERLDTLNEEKGWEFVMIAGKAEGWCARAACAAIQINPNEILVFGGCVKKDVDDAYVFDPETRNFARKTKLPAPSLFCQMTPVISGPLLGIIGWRNETVYVYNIQKDEWCLIPADKYLPEEFTEC